MIRYLRLYGYFLRFSFTRALEFRFDFLFRIVMDTLWYGHHLAFFWILYRHTTLLGGWSFDQMLVFAGGVFLVDAIQMTMLSNNMWMFPVAVNKGDLDYYLVRPVSSLFMASLRDFAVNSFLNLLMAIAVLIYALASYSQPPAPLSLAVFAVLLLAGLLVHYVLHILSVIPVFWTQSPSGFRELPSAAAHWSRAIEPRNSSPAWS